MNKRQFQRVHFLSRVLVETQGQSYETHCLDISLRGVLLVRPEDVNWHLEQRINVTLVLSPMEIIEMQCSLVHIDEDFVGCVCDSLDLESLTALRRLLQMNMADADALNRELGELIRTVH